MLGMVYAFLPPEINSTRMYAGPGAGSLLTAAGSWDAVAAELSATAEGYASVLSALTSLDWSGPASQAMAAAAANYVSWLQTAAEQAQQTAIQARAAAAAYEQAYAMTVPPPAVTANRTQLSSLVATNVLGQNTSAIAANEAQYADYWAQDTTAMSGYATSATAATQLTAFASPQQSTSPTGVATQNAAVNQANATAATSSPVSQAVSSVTNSAATTSAATTAASSSSSGTGLNHGLVPDDFSALDGILFGYASINGMYNIEAVTSGVIGAENNLGILPDLGAAAAEAPAALGPAALAPALASAPQFTGAASSIGGGVGLGNVSATLASAGTIGPMSVPANWAAPSTTHVSTLEPAGMTTLPGTDEPAASGYPGYPGMPGAFSRGTGVGAPPRYGVRLTVMPRPPAAG